MGEPSEPEATAQLQPAARGSEFFYLLIVEGASSRMFVLPAQGEVVIGRAPECQLRLNHDSVSRRHARIATGGGRVEIGDLGSLNGTRVDGARLEAACSIEAGNVITIGRVTLVLEMGDAKPHEEHPILALDEFRRRAEEEIARSVGARRPLGLLALVPIPGVGSLARVIAGLVRPFDVLGGGRQGETFVLLPESSSDATAGLALRLLGRLGPAAASLRSGFACCPEDGTELDTLLAGACGAAQQARPGTVEAAAGIWQTLDVGGRSIVVADAAMRRLYDMIHRLANTDLTVLILGETGTGKEVVATALHHFSARRERPLVALNCAAIPEHLFESELFGHEKGAFTGATAAKPGLLERAQGGTVLLDEVGELPPAAQSKLLRVLETRRLTRLGDVREREVDFRVLAATHRDLEAEVAAGKFRRDLFHRLSGGLLSVPPLRNRRREIPALAQAFVRAVCIKAGRPLKRLSEAALLQLVRHDWPGNIRELQSVVEYAAAVASGPVIELGDFGGRLTGAAQVPEASPNLPHVEPPSAEGAAVFRPLGEEIKDLERRRIQEALAMARGSQTRAAELIGMPLRTFQRKLKQHGLDPSKGRGR